jgi:glycosyltransferase involved in cell wall biosynthesis
VGLAADETGCGYYRIALPMQGLTALGYTTHHAQAMPRAIRYQPDTIIIGQRVCMPGPSSLWQTLARQDRKLIFEIDDDLWNIDASSVKAHAFFADPGVRQRLEDNIRVATAVTVTTAPLAERVAEWNPNVHIIPNAVPDWLLDHQPPQRDDGILTIGWGGSPTHQMDWDQAAHPVRQFLRRNPNIEFHCIGSPYMRGTDPTRSRFTPWVPDVETWLKTIDYHIGLTPLRPHVFNQAKSAIKATECAALGIPVVASAVRPYEDFIQHGVTGLLVHRDHEWGQHLRALVNDPAMRTEIGAAAREHARRHTVSAIAPLWEKAVFG